MAAATTLYESNICRLCSAECDDGADLFDAENSPHRLELIINHYLPVQVSNDGKLPRSICGSCRDGVDASKVFFDVLVAGQRRLRELWKEQVEREKREKRQNEMKSQEMEFIVQLVSDTGEPLFDTGHVLSLAVEGREVPRRRPGRPRKPKPPPPPMEPLMEEEPHQQKEAEVDVEVSLEAAGDLVVDPEKALELMFKEAEEKRLTWADDGGGPGRARRRRRVPQRFEGVVQGKELEAIFKEEGVIGPEEEEEDEEAADDAEAVGSRFGVSSPADDSEDALLEEDEEVSDEEGAAGGTPAGAAAAAKSASSASKSRVGRPKKRRFVCNYCGRSFLHAGHLTHHLRTRHRQSQFVCLACNDAFSTKDELVTHQQQTQHQGEGILDVHDVDLVDQPEEEPVDQPADDPQTEFKCCSCGQVFEQQSALTGHIVDEHTTTNGSICDLCGKTFSHPSSVIYHKEVVHSKGRLYACRVCNKGFKHKQLLQRHALVHSNDRPFVCHVCGATFKTRANLYNHNAVHNEEKRYQCTYCDAKFSHKTSLVLHTRWHTGEKPFSCNVCGKTFSQGGNLQEHMRIHTGEKPYQCQICSKRFTTSSQHRLHMKRHTGERPWKCEYCDKDFLHKDSWKCHLRRHRGEKPFSCPVCPRTFTEQWALKKHIRLHTGEKPYQCHVCNKAFSDLSNLQKHRKTHKNVSASAASNLASSQANALEEGVALEVAADGGGAGAAEAGQHIIYVTTGDGEQSQLLISALTNAVPASVPSVDQLVSDQLNDDNRHHQDILAGGDALTEDSVLTIVDGGGAAGPGVDDEIGQAVEFTTQDGRRVCLIIPPDVDPFEFTTEYLSNLS